ARKLGHLIDRIHRELSEEEILRIAGTYHAWRGDKDAGEYADIKGFCKSVTLDEIRTRDYVLMPGSYAGTQDAEDDGEPFDEKVKRLVTQLEGQFLKSAELETVIRQNITTLTQRKVQDG